MSVRARAALAVLAVAVPVAGLLVIVQTRFLWRGSPVIARTAVEGGTILAALAPAPRAILPLYVDSNSPVVRDRVDGQDRLVLFTTTFWGRPSRSEGRSLRWLEPRVPADFKGLPPTGGTWMEAVIDNGDGTWYGYYHNEPDVLPCPEEDKIIPRIGAARSRDRGHTWEDLGIVLDAPPSGIKCDTRNVFFLGGVGDFSVMLDPSREYLYLLYTQYVERPGGVGVSLARLRWADRDDPQGRFAIWRAGTWVPAARTAGETLRGWVEDAGPWVYPLATPIFPAANSWDQSDAPVDVFWGPSVHWNTYLQRYVILLNHAVDGQWRQGGVFVVYASRLDAPETWTAPTRITIGGRWYPQVLGLDPVTGSDKEAGEVARFFMQGRSDYYLRFRWQPARPARAGLLH
ncbi:MAG: hypothetical protein AB7O67_06800 [Vicinamibacterales bacterium]